MEPLGFLGQAGMFAVAVFVALAGMARIRGRRSRFDRTAAGLSSAAVLGVYPPSLRGGGPEVPPPPILDDEDDKPR